MKGLSMILGLLIAVPAYAVPDAVVHGVLMPAWLQRGTSLVPLAAGTTLENGDKLITGANARILLQAADGSTIKMGENANLSLDKLAQRRAGQSVFTALLNVAKGAFRFTTAKIARLKARDVAVRVAGATVGIRGTDVWGKDGKDDKGADMGVVCLIEGKVSVTGADNNEFVMDQPLSFYKMPKGAPPLPVAKVDPEQLKKWALETEIAAGQGAVMRGGSWKVDLLTAANESAALAAYDRWRTAGYAVRLQPVARADGWAYRLLIEQLPGRAQAEALAKQLAGKLGADMPEVSR